MIIVVICIYYIEYVVQFDVFSSIFVLLWWVFVMLIMVGYGDVVFIIVLGKIFGGFIIIMGICFYVLLVGILFFSYMLQMQLKCDRFKDIVRSVLDDGKLSEYDVYYLEYVCVFFDLDEEEVKLIVCLLQYYYKWLDD